ncbi:MAG: methyltransferase domain-containing protein, partial [Desulfamplus sp.]|nr:methyltransferase domain-containing protein [Desulfamplus sp.]
SPDFPPETFDVVISRHLVWTLPDPGKALESWKGLLKPGGIAVVIDGIWIPRDIPGHIRHFFADVIRYVKNIAHKYNLGHDGRSHRKDKTGCNHKSGCNQKSDRNHKSDHNDSSWKKEYMEQESDLPFFGGASPERIEALMLEMGFRDIHRDDMSQILEHERRHGPLEYRISYTKNRRYLISGRK